MNSTSPIPKLIAAKAPWDDTVLVCGKCMRKQSKRFRDGVDGDGKSLRAWLRKALKKAGVGKRVRVVQCGCLDLCPKHGVALARGRDLGAAAKPLRVFRSGDDPKLVLDWVLGDARGGAGRTID